MFSASDDRRIRTILMNKPPVNAFSTQSYRDLIDIVRRTGADDSIDVVIFASALPRVFCAGADVKEVAKMIEEQDDDADYRRQQIVHEAYDLVRSIAQPTIAAVEGVALGAGAVLASVCDIRVASSSARLGLPEITVGRCGGGRHLGRYLPQGGLRRMYFTGEPLTAAEASAFGLIDELTLDGEAFSAARVLAERIAANSPLALRLAKRALNESEFEPLSDGYSIEQGYTIQLGRSYDAHEALRAFFEKRPPSWQGR